MNLNASMLLIAIPAKYTTSLSFLNSSISISFSICKVYLILLRRFDKFKVCSHRSTLCTPKGEELRLDLS